MLKRNNKTTSTPLRSRSATQEEASTGCWSLNLGRVEDWCAGTARQQPQGSQPRLSSECSPHAARTPAARWLLLASSPPKYASFRWLLLSSCSAHYPTTPAPPASLPPASLPQLPLDAHTQLHACVKGSHFAHMPCKIASFTKGQGPWHRPPPLRSLLASRLGPPTPPLALWFWENGNPGEALMPTISDNAHMATLVILFTVLSWRDSYYISLFRAIRREESVSCAIIRESYCGAQRNCRRRAACTLFPPG